TFPEFSPSEINITVRYPGATAEDVEESICQRIEDSLESVSNIEEIRAEARDNLASVVVEMVEGADFIQFQNDVKTEVDAIDDFPDQAEEPVIRELGQTEQVISIAITGPEDPVVLHEYCKDIKDKLQRLEDISQVDLQGFSDRQIRIEIPDKHLMQYGLSVEDLAEIIRGQSFDLPAGTIQAQEEEYTLRFEDERRTSAEYADLIVYAEAGKGIVRLGNMAKISEQFELDEEKIIFNGKRAGVLRILKTKEEDAIRVYQTVQGFLEKQRDIAPPSINFFFTQDLATVVQDRIQMIAENGIAGLILVFLVMWLFFSFRFSFWVSMCLPISFFAAFFVMVMIGMSVNMISLVGFLIALGLLMDDSIVIAENVAVHTQRTGNAVTGAIHGVKEVMPGVFSSFVTTACVFAPLAFLEGTIGKILKDMPIVLLAVLSVSLVEAFFILPNHLSHSLHAAKQAKRNRFREWFDGKLEWVREHILGRVVDTALRWKSLVVGLTILLLFVSIGLVAGGVLKFMAFPDIDGDTAVVRLLLPQGTPLHKTGSVVKTIVDELKEIDRELTPKQPQKHHLVKNISVQYNLNTDAYEKGPHVATITADLLQAEIRTTRMDALLNRWREGVGELPDVIMLTFTEPHIAPSGRPFDIRIAGKEMDTLKQAAIDMKNKLASYQGAVDIADDLRKGKREIQVSMKEGALGLGITAASVASQLRSAFHGITADEIQVGDETIEIDVRHALSERDSLADLRNFYVTLNDGSQIPLLNAADIEYQRGWARIHRIDRMRTVSVQGDIIRAKGNAAQILAEIQNTFLPKLHDKYPNLRVSFAGEHEETSTTQGSMRRGMLFGIIGIFILLSFQFRSYLEPLIVMAAIPCALIGVIWGHVLMGLEITMPSIMGFISLAGIVVNDSILLVVFLKMRIKEGSTVNEAAALASRDRFRAILLTSLTTIAGLTPLLFERSLQAQVLIPLVTSVVFGLLASTFLVLVLIPIIYTWLPNREAAVQEDEFL
ncbi:MMPL family transporter, partial [bacterium]|nr:MMPL family transporter [bacterium]